MSVGVGLGGHCRDNSFVDFSYFFFAFCCCRLAAAVSPMTRHISEALLVGQVETTSE